MEAEDDHGADGDIDNDLGFESICTAPYMYDSNDRKETHDEIECDMNDDIALMNVPIEKDEANREGCYANNEVLFKARLFEIAVLADYIS